MVTTLLVVPEGHARDGQAPPYVYGYGGFGKNVDTTPVTSPEALPWVERGGIFVLAQIRGGVERGSAWHTNAIREKKQKTFDDLIAVAEYLEHEGYTSPAHLTISGASNGGLLVSSVSQQRPELFHAVIALAPVADMLRYDIMGSDAGNYWTDEYGTAASGGALFDALYSYSPYHQALRAAPRAYPKFFLGVGDNDTRVNPGHSYKLFAALDRAASPESSRVIRIGVGGDHSVGASIEEVFRVYGEALGFASSFEGPPPAPPKAFAASREAHVARMWVREFRERQVAVGEFRTRGPLESLLARVAHANLAARVH